MITIFVSHSVKDIEIVNSFVRNILNLGLGIENQSIRCVSEPSNKITPGNDWRSELKKDILSSKVIFQIITTNFLKSEMCQIEVGAAWVSEAIIIPIIVNPITFNNAGVIKEVEEIIKIDDSFGLDRIKDKLCTDLRALNMCKLVSTTEWNSYKETFLKNVIQFQQSIAQDDFKDIELEKNGFRVTSIDNAMQESTELLKTVKTMRVVGIGRQYYSEKSDDKCLINYLDAIESRLADIKQSFYCYRLTIMDLRKPFFDHLKRCFQNSSNTKYKNQFSLGIVDDLEMKFTYYVLGNETVFLNIYFKEPESKIVDSPFCLVSKNIEIVNLFIKHFDRVWEREIKKNSIIRDIDEFDKRIPYDARIIKAQKTISEYLKQIHHSSSRNAFALSEITQLERRLKGLIDYSLEIKYKVDNGKFLNIISNFLEQLHTDDTYETISFFEFWQNITAESVGEFIDANRKALSQGASINRIYLVDEGRLNEQSYINGNKKILGAHLKLLKNKQIEWKYMFKLRFINSPDYEEHQKDYRNFAIWQTKNEKVFFNPKWDKLGIFEHPIETQIVFIDKTVDINSPHSNYLENQSKFDKATVIYRGIKELVPVLDRLTMPQKAFLKKCEIPRSDWHLFFF